MIVVQYRVELNVTENRRNILRFDSHREQSRGLQRKSSQTKKQPMCASNVALIITNYTHIAHVLLHIPHYRRHLSLLEKGHLLCGRTRAGGSPPDIAAPSHQSFYGLCGGDGWTNIEVEDWLSCWLWRSGVVVNHISDFLFLTIGLSLDEPVMSIERRFSAEGCQYSYSAGQRLGLYIRKS